MAEPGSFADRVKSQADIVRIVGDYVRLKKSGQNFMGLCPFHSEKTPSFAVHPVRQIFHCFGCGVGGDVFKFVMDMEKCAFPEAVRIVAEKLGIPIPKQRPLSAEQEQAARQKAALVEIHRLAAEFFQEKLNPPESRGSGTGEGAVVRAYLEDRGLAAATIQEFGIGYAPAGGDALLRVLRTKFPDNLLEASGLVIRDESGRLYDRFRRRIMFPIANEAGKVIAFGGRAMGDEMPKYLNSPETPIYSKSRVLYNLHRAKNAIRQNDFAVLVEGYMDTIAVATAGVANVVASCGTSLTETQAKMLYRFSRHAVVSFDPDSAGVAATERSLSLLLEQGFDVRVVVLPSGQDPDLFVRGQGAEAYQKKVTEAPPYLDYILARARVASGGSDHSAAAGGAERKLAALNFVLPYIARIPDRILRSEWASRVAHELRIDEPILRQELRKSAADRRTNIQPRKEFLPGGVKLAERRLVHMLIESEEHRVQLAEELAKRGVHRGTETEALLEGLIGAVRAGKSLDPTALAETLSEVDRRKLFEIVFEPSAPVTWEEAASCLEALEHRRAEMELGEVQRQIEEASRQKDSARVRELLERKQQLRKRLTAGTQ